MPNTDAQNPNSEEIKNEVKSQELEPETDFKKLEANQDEKEDLKTQDNPDADDNLDDELGEADDKKKLRKRFKKILDEKTKKFKAENQSLEERLKNLESKQEIIQKHSTIKETMFEAEVNPKYTDFIFEKLEKAEDVNAEIAKFKTDFPEFFGKKEGKPEKKAFFKSTSKTGDIKSYSEEQIQEILNSGDPRKIAKLNL